MESEQATPMDVKGCSSKFHVGSRVRQTPEEGRRTYQPKRCGNNNEDEDNSPKTLNDKNERNEQRKLKVVYCFENPLKLFSTETIF